jgi:hypothetical protein
MEVRPVGAESFHAKRQTDGRTCMTKLLVAFRNSADVSNKVNADQRVVQQFSYQCSRDVKFPLNMVDNNLNNFSDSSVSTFCLWLVVNKGVFLGKVRIIYLLLLLVNRVYIYLLRYVLREAISFISHHIAIHI